MVLASSDMIGARARIVAAILALALGLWPAAAWAEDAVDRAAAQLKDSEDFRVRTQAALSLGASKSKRAVEPLCSGLEDSSATVRAASAAGLGKLKKGGESCLKKRLEDESDSNAKASIKKALAQLKAADSGEPNITSSTKYYIAIAKTSDKTGRTGSSVDEIVRSAMSKAAGNLDGYVIAPKSETTQEATKRLAKWKKLKAFYLSPKVLEPKYTDGKLQMKIDIAIFTYPGKALKGNIPVKLTQDDVSGKDTSAEDELLRMASERAIEKFSQNAEKIE